MPLPSLTLPPLPNRHLLMVFTLVVIIATLYQEVFTHSFVAYDDMQIIVDRVQHYSGINLRTLRDIVVDDYPREEPLVVRDLSYLLNAQLFGPLNPGGYLLGNLLLHMTVSYLVFLLAAVLFPGQTLLPAMAAILFAIHPLHCEAVAWISARKDTLYATFYLLAFLLYHNFLYAAGRFTLLVSACLFLAALFSKSAAISFLPFLLSYRLLLWHRSKLSPSEGLYLLVVAGATVWFVRWYSGVLLAYGVLAPSTLDLSRDWGNWAVVSLESLFFYLAKLLYPAQLAIIYTFPAPHQIDNHPLFLTVSLSVSFALACLLWQLRWRLDRRIPLLILWFCSALIPYLDLTPVGIYVANRYAYLASIPVIIGLVWLIVSSWQHYRPRASPLLLLLLFTIPALLLGRQTMKEVKAWRDTASLWEHALHQDPGNLPAYVALMGEHLRLYLENGRQPRSPELDQAAAIGERAMRRFSDGDGHYAQGLHLITSQLGQLAWYRGLGRQADELFALTFLLAPEYDKGRLIYATILAEQHRTPEALAQLALILGRPQQPINQGIINSALILQKALTGRASP